MKFQINDGGRSAAGYKGKARDCVTRAIAIATGLDYSAVYEELNRRAGRSVARKGVPKDIAKAYIRDLGWQWVPTMKFGEGCTVHLRSTELPATGPLIATVSSHWVAVVDGVIHDTQNPARDGNRCVYGYFIPTTTKPCGE